MKAFKEFIKEAGPRYTNTIYINQLLSSQYDKAIINYAATRHLGPLAAKASFKYQSGGNSKGDIFLFSLNSHDQNHVMGTRLKANEVIFRYVTYQSMAGKICPFVKVNIEKGMLYYLTEKAYEEDITEFETKGEKVEAFITVLPMPEKE